MRGGDRYSLSELQGYEGLKRQSKHEAWRRTMRGTQQIVRKSCHVLFQMGKRVNTKIYQKLLEGEVGLNGGSLGRIWGEKEYV